MKVKEENEKASLKLNIQKTKIMASSPITSWQTEGGKCENSDRFYFITLHNHQKQWKQWEALFGGLQITADGDCSHEIKRRLFLERKAMTNLDSI